MTRRCTMIAAAGLLLTFAAPPAVRADRHLNQIHKVIAGLNGFTGVQVIQLRMRENGENLLTGASLVAWDAAGQNPIVLATCDHHVANGSAGSRTVFATDNFASFTSPAAVPDFVMDNRIPDSYLPAGSLTWQNEVGVVWWRLCWGGAGYTGPTNMSGLNDPDLDCAPPWDGALPSTTLEALRFNGLFFAVGTNNLADYSIAPGPATFTTNSGFNTTVSVPPSSARLAAAPLEQITASPNPFASITRIAFQVAHRAPARFSVFDLMGRRVTQQAATLAAGEQSFEWRGVDSRGNPMPAGVYFLKLEIDEKSRTVPVVLVR